MPEANCSVPAGVSRAEAVGGGDRVSYEGRLSVAVVPVPTGLRDADYGGRASGSREKGVLREDFDMHMRHEARVFKDGRT